MQIKFSDYLLTEQPKSGKLIMTQKINILNEIHVQTINLKKNTAQGIYLVKVADINSKTIFTQKLVVQ
jgi:hypothetical protein